MLTRWMAVAACLALVAACTGVPPASVPATASPASGGVLRLGVPGDFPPPSALASSDLELAKAALDPQGPVWYDSGELFRCCLARTLLSYVGRPTADGGTTLRPDVAEALPEVSDDGLAWTFTLQRGLKYAPPLADVEMTAHDFARGLMRQSLTDEPAFRPAIVGLEEFISGTATTISGLEVPDPYTLRVRLTRPQGDLPARLAFPDTAPIPPLPNDPAAPLGVATGHDADYGRFFVASGPYMVEGAENIDFSLPPEQRQPAPGFVPGQSLTLVRNPSWTSATDDLRPAHAHRIEISIGGTQEELAARIDRGELDLVFFAGPPPHSPVEQIERYQADATLGTVHVHPRDSVRAIALNLALPPFDDLHVRRAASLVLNKGRLIELSGGPWVGQVAGHIVLDSLEDNLLLTYDPYRTPGSAGDLDLARAEMAQSRYDTDGDGVCDVAACRGLLAVTFLIFPELAEQVLADFAQLGIEAEVEELEPLAAFDRWFDPTSRTSFMVGLAYLKDHLNAATFFTANFDSRTAITEQVVDGQTIDVTNGTLVGASPEQLEAWGYEPLELPNIDDRIDLCHEQTGSSQVRCWAALDQHLMENVVPWIPYSFERHTKVVGPAVVGYSFDQSIAMPALDQIAVSGD
jgi:ABC-type transport system substrate-binding protein